MANQARSILRAADVAGGPEIGPLGSDGGSNAGAGAPPKPDPAAKGQVVVKKYANRRLYNTESSSYITLDSLAEMVRAGRDFVVYDAKTSEDITRSVLTQIIVEEESKGTALLPTGFLRQLISFYGDSMQGLVPRYLEQAMTTFGRQQQQMRVAMQQTMGNFFPFGIEEMGRQNMAMMERAMSLFTGPFYRATDAASDAPAPPDLPAPPPMPQPVVPSLEDFRRLQAEIEALRDQLAAKKSVNTTVPAPTDIHATKSENEKLPENIAEGL